MNEKVSNYVLFMCMGLVILDTLAFLVTSITGKVLAENNKMKNSYYAMLLIPIYIGLGIYFVRLLLNRFSKMNETCGWMSIIHLIGDLGIFAMQFLIVLGTCLSLIDGDVIQGYKFDVVVLIYGIFMFFGWIRRIVGGFTEFYFHDWEFFKGSNIRSTDEDENKKFEMTSTFLFKKDEKGFIINKYNISQMADWCRLFISSACFAIWKDFDDVETMASDLKGVFIAAMVYATLNCVLHIIVYICLSIQLKGEYNANATQQKYVLILIPFIIITKGFLTATLIGTLHGAAHYIQEESPMVFDYSIALSTLLVFKIGLWSFLFLNGKVSSMIHISH